MPLGTSAAAVANVFLDLQARDNSQFPPIDHMKLQKLVYYAHSWWLAYKNEPLFDDDIEAWPWGPVVRNLYGEFKDCGRAPIVRERATELIKTGNGGFKFQAPPPPKAEAIAFLGSVWASHKSLTGIQLSNSTHAEGEPWTIVKNQYGSLEGKPRIPNELIRDVFKAKKAKTEAQAAA
jgi:uncharacterized phage-associated protein